MNIEDFAPHPHDTRDLVDDKPDPRQLTMFGEKRTETAQGEARGEKTGVDTQKRATGNVVRFTGNGQKVTEKR